MKLSENSSDWKIKRLKSIAANITAGATPSTKVPGYWENGTIPWMNSGEINLRKVQKTEKYITQEGYNNSSTSIIPKNSVLMALAGQGKTRGKVAINEIELCTNQSLAAIIPGPDLYFHYLFHNLDYRYNELRRLSTGEGGRGGLNLKIISLLKIPFPPLEEQKKIANILSTWDRAIELKEEQVFNNKILKDNVAKKIVNSYKNDVKKSDARKLKSYLEPKSIKAGKSVIEPVAVGVMGIRKRSELFDKELSNDLSNNKVIEKNDLCFGIGTNRIVYGILLEDAKYCVSPAYKVFRIKNCNPYYLKTYLDAHNLYFSRKYMIISARQGKSIEFNGLMNEKFYLPSRDVQDKVVNYLESIDKNLEVLSSEIMQMKLQKQGLMQQLLTGKIRVQP